MTKIEAKNIEVHAHWSGMENPVLVGVLHVTPSRGREIFSFEYDAEWLQNTAHELDPALKLFSGQQYPSPDQENFGIFLDSSPDRWGRVLMDRREAQLAREEGRKEKRLLESDYLLGVYDQHRIGGLRFRTEPSGLFLNANKAYASPPWASLRELEHATLELEKNDAEDNLQYSKWLNLLIAPGSSLGGARPKASVVDEHNHLWIAKFPSKNDEYDIGAWEMAVFNLARKAQITVSEARLERFNSQYHTFLNKRFDRNEVNERIHYASAMTLLQRLEGDDWSSGASYLDLAEFIMQQGAEPDRDLQQLWRRIVFFMCISNIDDHLRNHGFLLDPSKGWVLSPAFDMNPVSYGDGLKLNVSQTDNAQDLELAKEVAEFFRIKPQAADEIINEIVTVTKDWRNEASHLKISPREQDRMQNAFRIADQS